MTGKSGPSNPQTIKAGINRVQFIFLIAPIRLSNNARREFHDVYAQGFEARTQCWLRQRLTAFPGAFNALRIPLFMRAMNLVAGSRGR